MALKRFTAIHWLCLASPVRSPKQPVGVAASLHVHGLGPVDGTMRKVEMEESQLSCSETRTCLRRDVCVQTTNLVDDSDGPLFDSLSSQHLLHPPITPTLTVHARRGISLALFDIRLHLGFRFCAYYGQGVSRIGRRTLVKCHPGVRLTEAITMKFVAENTSIPVPHVYDVFEARGHIYLVMEYIDAPSLAEMWPTMSFSEKKRIVSQMGGYLRELRSLRSPHPGMVEAVDRTGCYDMRLQIEPFGPFTVEEYHAHFGYDYIRKQAERYPQFQADFERCNGRKYNTVFTHGDLAPRNILVKDGEIVGIIDWECSGWYPEYSEYTTSWFSNMDCLEWWDMLGEVMDRYPDELKLEQDLCSVFVRC